MDVSVQGPRDLQRLASWVLTEGLMRREHQRDDDAWLGKWNVGNTLDTFVVPHCAG